MSKIGKFHYFLLRVIVQSLPKPKNWVLLTASKSVLYREFLTKRSDIKDIARPQNGSARIQSMSLNFDMFVQCYKVTQLHDIDMESVSDRRLNS